MWSWLFLFVFQLHHRTIIGPSADMIVGTTLIVGFLCNCAAADKTRSVRMPSQNMLIDGYTDHGQQGIMSLGNKGIQYIPKNAFMDFLNTTVSVTWFRHCLLLINSVEKRISLSHTDHFQLFIWILHIFICKKSAHAILWCKILHASNDNHLICYNLATNKSLFCARASKSTTTNARWS